MYHSTSLTSLDFMQSSPEDHDQPFKVVLTDWFDEKHLQEIHEVVLKTLTDKYALPGSIAREMSHIETRCVLPKWTTSKRDHADWQASDMNNDNIGVHEVRFGWTGRLPVRLERYYTTKTLLNADMYGWKVPDNFAEIIGNVARKLIPKEREVWCRWNYDLNWKAGDYRDGESCFWQSRAPAREVFRENGVIALLATKSDRPGSAGIGRCWVFPHKTGPMVFNAYGLPLITWANLIGTRYHRKHHHIGLTCERGHSEDGHELVYINHNQAYHMLEHGTEPPYEQYDLGFSYGEYKTCPNCHVGHFTDDMTLLGESYFCDECISKVKSHPCFACGKRFSQLEMFHEGDEWICRDCNRRHPRCDICSSFMTFRHARDYSRSHKGEPIVCPDCLRRAAPCEEPGCTNTAYSHVDFTSWAGTPENSWNRSKRRIHRRKVCQAHKVHYREVQCRTFYDWFVMDVRQPCAGCGKEFGHE